MIAIDERRTDLLRKVLCALLAVVCSTVSAAMQTAPEKSDGKVTTLDERLGPDDGAALAILFGANMRGNLSTCDCNFPRGGLARRVGYVEAFKKKFKDTPVLQVDGGMFSFGSGGYPDADLRNEQIALAFSRFPPDVINLGRNDLAFAQRLLAREGLSERTQRLPFIKNLISANGVFGPGSVAPAPYVVKEIGGPRIYGGTKKIRIGFVGVAAPTNPGGGL